MPEPEPLLGPTDKRSQQDGLQPPCEVVGSIRRATQDGDATGSGAQPRSRQPEVGQATSMLQGSSASGTNPCPPPTGQPDLGGPDIGVGYIDPSFSTRADTRARSVPSRNRPSTSSRSLLPMSQTRRHATHCFANREGRIPAGVRIGFETEALDVCVSSCRPLERTVNTAHDALVFDRESGDDHDLSR